MPVPGPAPAALPLSKRRRARLDNHADAQAKHREKLKAAKAPDRENVAAAALTVALLLVNNDPDNAFVRGLRGSIIGELIRDGFDRAQAIRRFDNMVERILEDYVARQRRRQWRATQASTPPATGRGSPGDAV